jgi:hypothetical protein
MAGSTFESVAFVEDAVLFFVTIVPLISWFDANPVLLANVVHVMSIACAGWRCARDGVWNATHVQSKPRDRPYVCC